MFARERRTISCTEICRVLAGFEMTYNFGAVHGIKAQRMGFHVAHPGNPLTALLVTRDPALVVATFSYKT